MIFGFTKKLLGTLLLANTLLVGVMTMLLYWSFLRGANNNLQHVEMRALNKMSHALIRGYELNGSWDFVRYNLPTWGVFLKFLPGGQLAETAIDEIDEVVVRDLEKIKRNPPSQFGKFARFPGPEGIHSPLNDRPRPDLSSLTGRLRLFDAEHNLIFGPPQIADKDDVIDIPLNSDGQLVGYLEFAQLTWLEEGLTEHFRKQQSSALLVSALIALSFSLVLSLLVGGYVTRPIRKLIPAVRDLSEGNLSIRITDKARDEFGDLIYNVNNLALRLEETDKLRRSMMADVSHELRTPLAVLQAQIEAIQDGIRPCNAVQMDSLHKSVANLSQLVNNLFTLSLSDSGKLVCHCQPYDVVNLLDRTFELYVNLFAKKNIRFTYELPDKARISADPIRLNQVLSNLLNNSYHYTDENGKSEVKVKVEHNQLRIQLQDSAPGVSDESLENLFTRFYRVDKSRSRSLGGAGLGLSLCQTIIEAHKGEIYAGHSQLGGVAITISLPLLQATGNKDQRSRNQAGSIS